MKFLCTILLALVFLAPTLAYANMPKQISAIAIVDSVKHKRQLDDVLRETRSALDSALSFFRSPQFDSLKSDLRQLVSDSKFVAKELRLSADSVFKMVRPYLDSIRPYIDSLTELGEELENDFRHGYNYSFRGLPKGFRFEGNLNESELWNFEDEWQNPKPRKKELTPLPRVPKPRHDSPEFRDTPENSDPPRFRGFPTPPRNEFQPKEPPGRTIPNYPGWKIQPLEQEEK